MFKGDFKGIPEAHAKCYQIPERISSFSVLIARSLRIILDNLTNQSPEENKCRIRAHAVSPNIHQNRT